MIKWSAILGFPVVILSFFALWAALGFPDIVAMSAEIEKAQRERLDLCVEVYDQRVRQYLISPRPGDTINAAIWDEEVEKAKRRRDSCEQQKIELGQ